MAKRKVREASKSAAAATAAGAADVADMATDAQQQEQHHEEEQNGTDVKRTKAMTTTTTTTTTTTSSTPAPAATTAPSVTSVAQIHQMEEQLLTDRTSMNHIVALLAVLKSGSSSTSELQVAATQALHRAFEQFAMWNLLVFTRCSSSSTASPTDTAVATLQQWVKGHYDTFLRCNLLALHSDDAALQASALHSCLAFVRLECQRNSTVDVPAALSSSLFARVMLHVCINTHLHDIVRSQVLFTKYIMAYDDLKLFALRQIKRVWLLSRTYKKSDHDESSNELGADDHLYAHDVDANNGAAASSSSPSSSAERALRGLCVHCGEAPNAFTHADFSERMYTLLMLFRCDTLAASSTSAPLAIAAAARSTTTTVKPTMFIKPPRTASAVVNTTNMLVQQRKALSEAWLAFLSTSHPIPVYKQILLSMRSHIFTAIASPLLLADFLTDSYNLGGVISILALDALFFLIIKHNLDYPHFYKKLYRLCKPDIFHTKYRVRFFQLVALFLTSAYLPGTHVAAFAKRFSRLALTAPPSGALFCIAVVFNMLRRHPSCRVLVNRPPEKSAALGMSLTDFLLARQKELQAGAVAAGDGSDVAGLLSSVVTTSIASGASKSGSSPAASTSAGVAAAATTDDDAHDLTIDEMPAGLADPDLEDDDDATANGADDSDDEWEEAAKVRVPPPVVSVLRQAQADMTTAAAAASSSSTLSSSTSTSASDPFLEFEDDLDACKANNSSLWEIATLAHHYCPLVANLAQLFTAKNAPKRDLDIELYVHHSYESILTKELERRKNQKVQLAYEKATG